MSDTDRRCGTCRYWDRWECHFPMPDIDDLAGVLETPICSAAEITYRIMTANRGTNCSCWEVAE